MGKHHRPTRTVRAVRVAALSGTAAAAAVVTQVTPAGAAEAPTVDWAPIIACESGGNPTVVNATGHGGLFQFSVSTWLLNGGDDFAPRAELATPAEQVIVAERAYQRRGNLGDWSASEDCWGGKVSLSATFSLGAVTPKAKAATPAAPKAVEKATAPATPPATGPRHASGAEASAPANPAGPRHGERYTVRAGDTLSGIAAVLPAADTVQTIFDANAATIGDNPDLILIGEVLQL